MPSLKYPETGLQKSDRFQEKKNKKTWKCLKWNKEISKVLSAFFPKIHWSIEQKMKPENWQVVKNAKNLVWLGKRQAPIHQVSRWWWKQPGYLVISSPKKCLLQRFFLGIFHSLTTRNCQSLRNWKTWCTWCRTYQKKPKDITEIWNLALIVKIQYFAIKNSYFLKVAV